MANAWDRLDHESALAYYYFTTYLNMEDRKYVKVAEKVGKSHRHISEFGTRFNWVERAEEWDAAIESGVLLDALKEYANLQLSVVQGVIRDGQTLLALYQKALERQLDKEDMVSPDALIKLVAARRQIDDLLRRAVKLPTSYKDEAAPQLTEPEKPRELSWLNSRNVEE